jgi:PAS domain S-box-containing protein
VEVYSTPWVSRGQNLLFSIIHDITDRKQTEQELERMRNMLSEGQRIAHLGSWEYIAASQQTIWSDEQKRIYGLDPTDPAPHFELMLRNHIHPDDAAELNKSFSEALGACSIFENENRIVRPDGSIRYIFNRAQPCFDDSGNLVRYAGATLDITDRKQAEEAVLRNQTIFHELIERSPFGTYVVDSQFRIAIMNTSSQAGAFRNVQPLIGRDLTEVVHTLWPEEVAVEIIGHFRHTLDTGEPYYSRDFINPRHDADIVEAYEWELHRIALPDGQDGAICYYYDSTKLREAEAAERASRTKLAAAFASMTEAIFIADANGRLMDFNDEFIRYHRFKDRDECSRTIDDCPKYLAAYFADGTPAPPEQWAMPRALRGEIASNVEYRLLRKETGETWWGSYSFAPIKDNDGRIVGAVVSAREITALKKAEEALRESEVKYRNLFDNMVEEVHFWKLVRNEEGQIITWRLVDANPPTLKSWGRTTLDDIKGKTTDEIFGPGTRDHYLPIVQKIMTEGVPYVFEDYFPNLDKHSRYTSVPLGDYFISTGMDITDIKKAQDALRVSEQHLRSHIENTPLAVVEWGKDFIVTRWAGEAEKTFGWLADDVVGKPIADLNLIYEPDILIVQETMAKLTGGNNQVVSSNRNITKDGRVIHCNWYNSVQMDEQGKMESVLSLVLDITGRKQAEESLKTLNEDLEKKVSLRTAELREKDQMLLLQSRQAAMGEMIGNISHQWRQPLNILGMQLQQLPLFYDLGQFNKELLNKNVAGSMKIIKHMSKTIDDFRNYFKPDKEKTEFNVHESINSSLLLLEGSLKNPVIDVEVVAKDDPIIYGFPNEFAQVILNIMNNARDVFIERNVRNPKVNIKIYSEGMCGIVTIADNAGGIPEEIINKVFDPYFTTKGPQQGTGVGLFMSKSIIENNMGGRLHVRNIAGGAEFRIEV